MARLGLDYETVAAINPRVVYAGLFGFGQGGPYAARPAYDDLIQGGATLPHLDLGGEQGAATLLRAVRDGRPHRRPDGGRRHPREALLARERSGRGQRVDVPMFETMVGFVPRRPPRRPHLRPAARRRRLRAPALARVAVSTARATATSACWSTTTSSGRASCAPSAAKVAAAGRRAFATFANRSRHIDCVYGELARIFEQRSTAEWMALLEEADAADDADARPEEPCSTRPCTSSPRISSLPASTRPRAGSARCECRADPVPSAPARGGASRASLLGEHSVEVLPQAGYSGEEIDALIAQGAVLTSSAAASPDRGST